MSIFGFPDAALIGMLKKAALHLPQPHKTNMLGRLSKQSKDPKVIENAKKFVTCLLSARMSSDEQFKKDVSEAFTVGDIRPEERELYLGWLGGKLAMALAEAKKGVDGSRLDMLREAIKASSSNGTMEGK